MKTYALTGTIMKGIRNRSRVWMEHYRSNDFLRKLTTVLGLDILAKASGFILIPVYLRLMTQEEYGSYNFIVSIVQMLGLLLTFGLYIPQTKLYHSLKSKEEKGSMLFTIVVTLFFINCLMVFLVFGAGIDFWFTRRLFKNNFFYPRYRFILLMAVLVTMMGYILTYYLFATERIRQVRAYNIWRMIFVGLTVLAMVFFREDTVKTRLLFTFLSELLLIMVFSSYFIKEMAGRFSVRILLKSLGMGIPIMMATLFGIIVNFSDKFFLEKFGNLKDLSTYYLAFSFAGVLPLISASLQNVWMPEFLKETNLERNSDRTRKLIYRLLLTFFILGLLIWIMFLMLVQMEIIPSKYEKGTYVLPILLLSQIFMAITTLLNNYLIYFEKTYVIFFSGLFVSSLSIALSLVLIPWGGIHGAAYTILISNSIYLLTSHFLVRIYKKIFLSKLVSNDTMPLRPVA